MLGAVAVACTKSVDECRSSGDRAFGTLAHGLGVCAGTDRVGRNTAAGRGCSARVDASAWRTHQELASYGPTSMTGNRVENMAGGSGLGLRLEMGASNSTVRGFESNITNHMPSSFFFQSLGTKKRKDTNLGTWEKHTRVSI